MERMGAYVLCIVVSFLYAGFTIVSKICLDKGLSKYVLVAYGHALGALTCAILAFFFERNNKSKLNFTTSLGIFVAGLLAAGSHVVFYVGLEETSPAFASAMTNLIPSVTFILAVVFRMEKLKIKKLSSQAKLIGTVIAFGGAALMALYKGVSVISLDLPHYSTGNDSNSNAMDGNLVKGSIFLLLHCVLLSAFYLYQAVIIKMYPAPMSLTTLTCVAGAIHGVIIATIVEHKASSWRLSSDITLLAPIYSGIMVSGLAIYLQVVAIRAKGPVFVASFRPLSTVIAAIMGLFILGAALHLGEILGATMITLGLYACLWGKEREKERKVVQEPPSQANQLEADIESGEQNSSVVGVCCNETQTTDA